MKSIVKPRTYGRMGNFLFQAAAAMGYAWRHGLDYNLPNTTADATHNPIYLQHLVKKEEPLSAVVIHREKTHGYQTLPFSNRWAQNHLIILDGYWQTEKYFKEFRERILNEFGYPWTALTGVVSVHVRRTDYLTLTQKHPPVPKEWIEKAMAQFPGARFLFFSDDIAWCKQAFGNRSDVMFACADNLNDCWPDKTYRSEELDLIQMSWCEHHICSASTFSWWGAWLNHNPNKRVIMPRHWFQPGYRKTDTKDIVPEEWERLDL